MLRLLLIRNKLSTLNTKLLFYKVLLKPIWMYGLYLWDVANKSNTKRAQTFQNTSPLQLFNTLPYISDLTLRNVFHNMLTTEEEAHNIFYTLFHKRLQTHLILS